jgi:O-antigen ligase
MDRFQFWTTYLKWWLEGTWSGPEEMGSWAVKANHWIGTGAGTFRHLGPEIQIKYHLTEGKWWPWAHNDWLQILFETGYIGLLSSVWVLVEALKRLYKYSQFGILGSVVAYVVIMCGNYPMRLAEYSVLGILFLGYSFKLGRVDGPGAIQLD